MTPHPLYEPHNISPAYQLRYAWTAWVSGSAALEPLAEGPWSELQAAWEADGLRVLEPHWSRDMVQVVRAEFADRKFQDKLADFTVSDPSVDLASPSETLSGRYWYNLHVVLVTAERGRFERQSDFALIRDKSIQIAAKKGHKISRLSVMPDHLHIALRGNLEHSPQDIALAFQNNLAYALGQNAVWKHTYYAGTFSEYDIAAIRAATPAGSPGR